MKSGKVVVGLYTSFFFPIFFSTGSTYIYVYVCICIKDMPYYDPS